MALVVREAKKRNAQGPTRSAQTAAKKTIEQRVKDLEDAVNEFCGTALSEWEVEVERQPEPRPFRRDEWQPGEK